MHAAIRSATLAIAFVSLCALFGVRGAYGVPNTSLTGVIFDQAGDVLPGASVTVLCLDRALEARTNSDAAFEFTSLPPGTYTVWVTAKPFLSQAVENVQIVEGRTRQLIITMKFELPPCGIPRPTISYENKTGEPNLVGDVSVASDGPLKGATIKVTALPSGHNRITTTRQDGTFQFSGLEPGRYKLTATHRGWSGAFVTNLGSPVRISLVSLRSLLLSRAELESLFASESLRPGVAFNLNFWLELSLLLSRHLQDLD
jgi:hypothetical protein